MLSFSGTVASQIRYLLENATEANSDSILQELRQYIGFGTEGSILVLGICFNQLIMYGNDLRNMAVGHIFASIIRFILEKPNSSTVLCESIISISVGEDILHDLCNSLQLSAPEKIGIGLALSDSENLDIRMCGRRFTMAYIAEMCVNCIFVDSVSQIQNILMFLNKSEDFCKHVDLFMQTSLRHSYEDSDFILAPLLSDELHQIQYFRYLLMLDRSSDVDSILSEMEEEMRVDGVMKELGYACTVNVSWCKEMLSLFLPLTEKAIARILGTVVRSNTGLENSQKSYLTFCAALGSSSLFDLPVFDSWNTDVLIDSINQVVPGINWISVFENLDQEGFYIPNEAAFILFMSIFRHACQDPFPLHAVCGFVWKNAEGQLSFLKYAVSVPPEIFSFAHSGQQLAHVDTVTGDKFQPGHVHHAWLCLDLLEVLAQLSERGYSNSVRPMLQDPLMEFPEVLLLGMANINTAYNLLQWEVFSVVFPSVLKSPTGSNVVLHLWYVNPNILLRGFIEAFTKDPIDLIRVLHMFHELKILSTVLEKIPYSCGVRLAAFAAGKDLIDLESWLSTSLITYKDALFEECLKFVKEVDCSSQNTTADLFHQSFTFLNLCSETIPTFVKVLYAHAHLIYSDNLYKEVKELNLTVIRDSTRLTNNGHADFSSLCTYGDDTVAEFQKIAKESATRSSSPSLVRPLSAATAIGFGSALNIETLVAAAEKKETPIEAPASEIQDRISFMFNNLSLANIEVKAKEFSELLTEKFYPWFAQYFVMKRASIENNYHDLYLKFLDAVNSKPLNKEVLQSTYENCKVLLRSELINSSSEELSLLKNLGSWLGKFTVGRNQVLRARDLDPKSLIIEAYEKGMLVYVVPFISKLLKPCHNSLAYQPPNPWIMGILRLLAEIYAIPNMKLNLKFEIEVLFRDLSVEMIEVTPTSLLTNKVREEEGNPQFSPTDAASSKQQTHGKVKSGTVSAIDKVKLPPDIATPSLPSGVSRILSQDEIPAAAVGMSNQLPSAQGSLHVNPLNPNSKLVVVNPKLHSGLHTYIQSLVPIAMNKAIKEAVSSQLQRSVSIAIQTTRELVSKDNATESDETRIYDAARLMVSSLSGDLAYATCKEPLRDSVNNQLMHSLEHLGFAREQLELAVELVTDENLDLGCALIEQTATDKAKQSIDMEIAKKLSVRRKQRECLGPLSDTTHYEPGHIPEVICLGPGRISHSRLQVYDGTGYSAASYEDYNVLDSVEPDHVGFHKHVSRRFSKWCYIFDFCGANDSACADYVLHLLQSGLLEGDDMSDRFFCCLTELSVSQYQYCGAPPPLENLPLSFVVIDAYAALVLSIFKFYPVNQGSKKLFLLSKVLGVTVRFIREDADDKKTNFNPRPYFRLFINWLLDLPTLEPSSDGANLQVITAFANAFHALQPLEVPAFSFAWLELVSHRSFMPKLLSGNSQKGWPFFQRLLVDLFKFLEPYMRNYLLREPVRLLYKGTLRVLLVVLRDFPEFLCDYHFSFSDVIPPSCIQVRNIILSAFPRNMKLPDPSSPNFKINTVAGINQSPRILSEVDAALEAYRIKGDLDEYLKMGKQGSPFLFELKQKLLLPPNDAARAQTAYNMPLINSLVLYVGMQVLQAAHHVQLAVLDIFQTLIVDLDTEGRYFVLNAIANQLRYPNCHTYTFSFILQHLFANAKQEIIQEQICRVLLERLIIKKTRPWGVLVTLIELVKNPVYKFWSLSFTRRTADIQKLFALFAIQCGASKSIRGKKILG